jgi:hypothetical protein
MIHIDKFRSERIQIVDKRAAVNLPGDILGERLPRRREPEIEARVWIFCEGVRVNLQGEAARQP